MRGMMRLALLGVPGAQGEVIDYLLLDQHLTPRTVGGVDGTDNEPGPGSRDVTDTSSSISIANERLHFKGEMAQFDGLLADDTFSSVGGRAFGVVLATRTVYATNFTFQIATHPSFASQVVYGIGTTLYGVRAYDGPNPVVNDFVFSSVEPMCWVIVLRPTQGGLLFARNGLTGAYKLVQVFSRAVVGDLYVRLGAFRGAASANIECDSRAIVDLGGAFATDWGLTSQHIVEPDNGEITQQPANAHILVTWTPDTGEVLDVQVRGTDDDNCWIVRCTQATNGIALIKKEAGEEDVVGSSPSLSVTWSVGDPITINIHTTDERIIVSTQAGSVAGRRHYEYTSASFNNSATRVKVSGSDALGNLAVWPEDISLPAPFDSMTISDDEFERIGQRTLWTGVGEMDWVGRASLSDLGDGVWAAVYRQATTHGWDTSGEVHIRFSGDEGVSWTEADTYLDGNPVTGAPFQGTGNNDTDVPLIHRAPNGDVLLLVGQKAANGIAAPAGVQQFRSLDGGKTFADEGLVIEDLVMSNEIITIGTTLYLAVWSALNRSELWKSEDDGETYTKVSNITESTDLTDECTIAWLGDSKLLAIIRQTANTSTYWRVSEDMGATWGDLEDGTLDFSVLNRPRLHIFADDPDTIYLTARNARPYARTAVFVADKNALDWSVPFYPDARVGGDQGYTDLLKRSNSDLYMLGYYGEASAAVDVVEYVFRAASG